MTTFTLKVKHELPINAEVGDCVFIKSEDIVSIGGSHKSCPAKILRYNLTNDKELVEIAFESVPGNITVYGLYYTTSETLALLAITTRESV